MFESDIYGLALIALGACGLLIYVVLLWPVGRLPDPWPRRFYRAPARFEKLPVPDLTDVGQQLHAVMAASFQRRRLLSRSEFETFRINEIEIAAAGRGYRVFAQTNLGEILSSLDENAFRSINSSGSTFSSSIRVAGRS